jgi:predicted aspartyl protease
VIGRCLAAACLLVGLAACAADPPGSSNACAFVRKGEIDVRFVNGVPIADVTIDGHVVPMIIDTGAQHTALTDTTAETLHLRPDDRYIYQINGVSGGMTTAHPMTVEEIAFGGVTVHPAPIPVVPRDSDGAVNPAFQIAAGILGLDVLARYDLDLDLPHQRIVLMQARDCPHGGPPWAGRAAAPPTVQGALVHDNLLVWVRLDGLPVAAMFDTGDTNSTVSPETAHAVGVDDAALGADQTVRVNGVNKSGMIIRVHRFHQLVIGGLAFANPAMTVQPLPSAGVSMLIGENLFRRYRVYISYASRRVFIAP